jgi:hypothetical protein
MVVQPLPMEPSRIEINIMMEIIRLNMELHFKWNQERKRWHKTSVFSSEVQALATVSIYIY